MDRETLRTEVKQLIVSGLRLPMAPTDLGDETSIFGEDLISEKSLDEVILSYLSEDLETAGTKK